MINTIIFASGNKNKIREMSAILSPYFPDVSFVSMRDIGFTEEIEENGQSYRENALLKAKAIADFIERKTDNTLLDWLVLADDSGLEIDAFHGEPGIFSARWLGENTPQEVKNQTVLERMRNLPHDQKSCRYRCHMAAIDKDGHEYHAEGIMEGFIANQPRGLCGFGYDPIFELCESDKTVSELSAEEKNRVSHRTKALQALCQILSK